MRGVVKWFDPLKGYGFIRPETGQQDVFVHLTAVHRAGLQSLKEDQLIDFEMIERRGRQQAEELNVISEQAETDEDLLTEEIADQDVSVTSTELVKEVAQWKLEARSEDNDRYFFHVKEVSSIENGDKCYVIGRKGSGKTAISEYRGGPVFRNRMAA
jgi:cold shock protein